VIYVVFLNQVLIICNALYIIFYSLLNIKTIIISNFSKINRRS
jgi:hypothetical protein